MSEYEGADIGEPIPSAGRRLHYLKNWHPSEGEALPRYIPSQDAREELTLNLMTYQYIVLVLMRRFGAETTKITAQEVELVKRLGIYTDIEDDGGITVKVNGGMGS